MNTTITAPVAAPAGEHRRLRTHPTSTRLTARVESVVLALIAGGLLIALVVTAQPRHAPSATERVRVDSGQTLWTLAEQHPVQGLTTEQTADLIAEMNRVPGGRVRAGMIVRVPAPVGQNPEVACRE